MKLRRRRSRALACASTVGTFACTRALPHRTHFPLAAGDARRRPIGEPVAAAECAPRGHSGRDAAATGSRRE